MQTRMKAHVTEDKKKQKTTVGETQMTTSISVHILMLILGRTALGSKANLMTGGTSLVGASANVTAADKEEMINDL